MVQRTRSQEKILSALRGLSQPISAQDLYMEMRQEGMTVGLATVYRALEALKLAGAVQMRTLPSGEALYSLTLADRHHLTCLHCGSTIAIDDCPVHDLEQQLHQAHHFKIFYHTLEFFGLCPHCQANFSPVSQV
ncbi:MAG: Fur family transcriptional regulator [Nodosilinea sp.]